MNIKEFTSQRFLCPMDILLFTLTIWVSRYEVYCTTPRPTTVI